MNRVLQSVAPTQSFFGYMEYTVLCGKSKQTLGTRLAFRRMYGYSWSLRL